MASSMLGLLSPIPLSHICPKEHIADGNPWAAESLKSCLALARS